jgi:hypothetical protein
MISLMISCCDFILIRFSFCFLFYFHFGLASFNSTSSFLDSVALDEIKSQLDLTNKQLDLQNNKLDSQIVYNQSIIQMLESQGKILKDITRGSFVAIIHIND